MSELPTQRPRLDAASHLTLALRNLWRNPKRTLLTLFSMVLGIAALTLLSALNDGWLKEMQDNFVLAVTGHVQVHARGFEASQNLHDRMPGRIPAAKDPRDPADRLPAGARRGRARRSCAPE